MKVQVLLAKPDGSGFKLRADDPGEKAEAEKLQRARPRAKAVYDRIGGMLQDDDFRPHINAGRLTFYVYDGTPLSAVWVDDDIWFTPYLPSVSDSACPEFTIKVSGEIGASITNAIEQLIRHQQTNKIEDSDFAAALAAQCEVNGPG